MRDLTNDVEETASIVLAHSALLTSMMGMLLNKRLIDRTVVNEVFDLALVGLETTQARQTAHAPRRQTLQQARIVLEEMAQEMRGEVER